VKDGFERRLVTRSSDQIIVPDMKKWLLILVSFSVGIYVHVGRMLVGIRGEDFEKPKYEMCELMKKAMTRGLLVVARS
jgi:hypothetical protein